MTYYLLYNQIRGYLDRSNVANSPKAKEYAEENKIAATRTKMIMYIFTIFIPNNLWRITHFGRGKAR